MREVTETFPLPSARSLWRRAPMPSEAVAVAKGFAECLYLGRNQMVVRTKWGGWVVVPSFNVDVAIGVMRDGVIEPATTRLVQELVRPGDHVINGGANFGYYSSLMGGMVGNDGCVIAVEANEHIIPYLMMTRIWAGLNERMQIYHRALWETDGQPLEFNCDPQFIGGNSAAVLAGCEISAVGATISDALWSSENLRHVTSADGRILVGHSLYIKAHTTTATIDRIVPADRPFDMIQLDIEGAEAFALLGARELIRRSPRMKIIMEWSARAPHVGTPAARDAAERMLRFLAEEGFRCRHLEPGVADNGAIFVSPHLSAEHMLSEAVHGDYVWCRPFEDPWG